MTLYLLDVASYQGDLDPADVKRAGFDAVNLKVSHGLGTKSVHPNLAGWIVRARELGLAISTFHYLDASAPGSEQADYAHQRLWELGLAVGTAHQVDVESDTPPALAEVRAYLARMTGLLGRPVVLYTGDWWWTARPGWNVADLTPYLWAAPNAGYLDAYPGDTSSHWRAGYGGWPQLAAMQYAVAPLSFPGGSTGVIKVSKSAIRDPAVWAALTAGGAVAISQNGWPVDASGGKQDRDPIHGDVTVPNGVLRGDVATVLRWVARRYHETVEPLVKGSCWGWFVKPIEGSETISNHASGTAIDLNASKHPMGVATSQNMTAAQISACRAIVKAAGGVVRWGGDYTGRPDPMHWEIVGTPAATAALAARIRTEEDDDMTTKAEFIEWLKDGDVRRALAFAVLMTDNVLPAPGEPAPGKNPDGSAVNTHWSARSWFDQTLIAAVSARVSAAALLPYAKAEALEGPEQTAAAVLGQLASAGRSDTELAAALRAALGDRAAEVGRLLAA